MRAADLRLQEMLEIAPEGGLLRFGGERAVILDAVALGILRRELIETCGETVARGVLQRFGYAHGWRTADMLKQAYPWDHPDEWRTAGGRLHTITGLVRVEPVEREGGPFAEVVWHDSFEAEQHLLLLGPAREAMCWTLVGFASGYLTRANGKEILCVEDRCRAKGDACCHLVGKPAEEWGDEAKALRDSLERKQCLEEAFTRAADALKKTEKSLAKKRRLLTLAAGDDAIDEGSGIVAASAGMRRVLDLARRVAKVDSSVLVTGESGVGKERLARLIHDESARAAGPFVAVNCGALPESLLESELFGHARGAFTGATQERVGLFEAASRGTLFLDEIGEVPPAMQVKLLRALQEREVRRVGENKVRPIDVRLVAATNRDLAREVQAGRFREDLYYRLRVVELRVPPLRERLEDVLPLARALLAETSERLSRPIATISPQAAALLARHRWPGNVRELKNAIERAVALAQGSRVEEQDLPDELKPGAVLARPFSKEDARTLDDVERDVILAALAAEGGSRTAVARRLGIGEATLRRKIRRYKELGIQVDAA